MFVLAHAGGGGVDSKVWAVSASLRGFYDDNYATTPKKVGSYGFEVSPDLSVSAPLGQTEIGLRYIYGLYYYQKREQLNARRPTTKPIKSICGWTMHSTERWHGKTLRYTGSRTRTEATLINGTGTPYRVNGKQYCRLEPQLLWIRIGLAN